MSTKLVFFFAAVVAAVAAELLHLIDFQKTKSKEKKKTLN